MLLVGRVTTRLVATCNCCYQWTNKNPLCMCDCCVQMNVHENASVCVCVWGGGGGGGGGGDITECMNYCK